MASNRARRNTGKLVDGHRALCVIGLCGLIGVLVDVDHAISLLLWRYLLPEITEGRILHTPLLIISCLVICGLGACRSGLYPKLVLVGVLAATVPVLVYSPYVIWGWW